MKTIIMFISVYFLSFFGSSEVNAEVQNIVEPKDTFSCIDDLLYDLNNLTTRERINFCENYHEGWTFTFSPTLGSSSLGVQGTIDTIFGFRQQGWQSGDTNSLSFELVPYKEDVFQIYFKDNDETYECDGERCYYLWGMNQRLPQNQFPFRHRWTNSRLIRCIDFEVPKCRSYYTPVVCQEKLDVLKPVIIVSSMPGQDGRDDFLENFEEAHSLVKYAMEAILKWSCTN